MIKIKLKLTEEQIAEISNINVLEYSEEQGYTHSHTLIEHIQYNIDSPENQFFIIKPLDNIPQWVFENNELMKYVRIKTYPLIDFSHLHVEIPQIGIVKE